MKLDFPKHLITSLVGQAPSLHTPGVSLATAAECERQLALNMLDIYRVEMRLRYEKRVDPQHARGARNVVLQEAVEAFTHELYKDVVAELSSILFTARQELPYLSDTEERLHKLIRDLTHPS